MGTIAEKLGSDEAPTRRSRANHQATGCVLEATLAIIGGRWKGVVLYHLLKGKKRFGELRRMLPNCTQRMLTLQLRELEEDGLVKRTVYAEVPPRVEYELTPFGKSAETMLLAMREWGEKYHARIERLSQT